MAKLAELELNTGVSRNIYLHPHKEENPKSIMLSGKARIGKSLFCEKVIRDWANCY